MQRHAWEVNLDELHDKPEPTPFISVTPDPLRAFNRALHLDARGEEEICIVVIDAWILDSANVIACNRLRSLVGEEENHLFDTEVLVWQHIPGRAIIARWSWEKIRASLGGIFPPLVDRSSIPESGKRPLWALRNSLQAITPGLTMSDLARVLVEDLGLFHESMTTKQVALMMIGWCKRLFTVKDYSEL